MNELYWITRLDAINGSICVILCIAIVAIIANGIHYSDESLTYSKSTDEYKILRKNTIKRYKIFGTVFLFTFILNIFVPSEKDALIIYGVGGTIDYIKSNDKAMKLPDKCIDALDKYLDNINEDKQKKEK